MLIGKIGLASAAALLGFGLLIGESLAFPLSAPTVHRTTNDVQKVTWVCDPYRCWWAADAYAPGYVYYYGYYGPRYSGYYGYYGPRLYAYVTPGFYW